MNARYYDPEVGRFISADETLDGGYNLFEYCLNNPISLCDCNGKVPIRIGMSMSGPNFSPLPDGCKGYNCYWWALNRIKGSYNTFDPPGMENRTTIHTIVDLARGTVKGVSDEGAHGAVILGTLTDAELQTEINSLSNQQYLIALRLNPRPYGDYHYMRLEADGTWTHKQGLTGDLFQLNGNTPNDDEAWRAHKFLPTTEEVVLLPDPLAYTTPTWYIRVTI